MQSQRLIQVLLVVVDGQERHLATGVATKQLGAHVQPARPVQQDDIRQTLGHQPHRVLRITRLTDDLDTASVRIKHGLEAVQHDLVVIDEQEPKWRHPQLPPQWIVSSVDRQVNITHRSGDNESQGRCGARAKTMCYRIPGPVPCGEVLQRQRTVPFTAPPPRIDGAIAPT